ncbi:hypothetical protein DEAC_c38110 [Desulfosporosinus acididurans]|uniref:Tautomerase enzyme n=1 Tax=Desulfosporosinus acididurans TaxID=476652 RepID=A0A0J1FMI5_9FIRM|nr:hypothetical protein DEAC_c38110 [Desulfosporosinus acididurans]
MPFLRFKGFEKSIVKKISPFIIDEFSNIVSIPRDMVKIELLHVEQVANSPLSVEIFMFQRQQKEHDALASMIYKKLYEYGYKNPHIFFVILTPSLYYKEGKPLNEIPKNLLANKTYNVEANKTFHNRLTSKRSNGRGRKSGGQESNTKGAAG